MPSKVALPSKIAFLKLLTLGSVLVGLSLAATAAITSREFGFFYVTAKFVFIVFSSLLFSSLVFARDLNFQIPKNKNIAFSACALFLFTAIATLFSHTGEQVTGVSLIVLWVLIATSVSAFARAEGASVFLRNFISIQAPLIALSYLYFLIIGITSDRGFTLNPFFGNPNISANYVAVSLVSLLFFSKFTKHQKFRSSAYLFILIGFALLICLKARGALIGVLFAFLYFFWIFYREQLKRLSNRQRTLGGAGLVLILLAFATFFSQKGLDSLKHRFAYWVNTACMMKDYPLGVGAGSFEYVFQRYNGRCYPAEDLGEGLHVRNPHNMILEFSAEIGILGVLALLLFFFFIYQELRKKPFRQFPVESTWVICSALVILGIGLLEFPQDTPYTFYFMAIPMGLSLALIDGTQNKQSSYLRIGNLAASLLVFIIFSMKSYSDHLTFKPGPEAAESYKAACAFDSENWRACTHWALAELKEGNTELTEKIISKLDKKFGEHHSQIHLRGTYAEKRGDLVSACKEFTEYNVRFGSNTSKKAFLEKNCTQ